MNNPNNLVIIEKYEDFIDYFYPILQNIKRNNGIVKERIINLVFEQVDLFYKAIKSNSKTKLYDADANLATIRFYLRFLAHKQRKLISQKQHQTASVKIAEVGKILHSWINK